VRELRAHGEDLCNSRRLRIGYPLSMMTDDERMQRESSLSLRLERIFPISRRRARMTRNSCCFTKTLLPPTTKRTNTRSSEWRSSTLAYAAKKYV
jgi:hypothetical protein